MISDKQREQNILEQLEPLFKEAEKEGLWFYGHYQSLWFSPVELREKQKEGNFIWGPTNWKLRDPEEQLMELYKKRANINRAIKELKKEIKSFKNG